jgi:hypothetical protein
LRIACAGGGGVEVDQRLFHFADGIAHGGAVAADGGVVARAGGIDIGGRRPASKMGSDKDSGPMVQVSVLVLSPPARKLATPTEPDKARRG